MDLPSPPTTDELEWTGERLVTGLSGQIVYEHLHRYALARELAAGLEVLDIACGEGYGSALLSSVARSVVGVDNNFRAIEHAARKYTQPNLRFVRGDCGAIPLPDACVDLVVSFETIEHFAQHEAFLDEVRRVLRPSGVLIISTPDRATYKAGEPKNQFHVRELSRDEFDALLRARWAQVALFGQRYACVSVVLREGENPATVNGTFTGNFSSTSFSPGLAKPVYLLAVCSAEKLPAVQEGIFELEATPRSTGGAEGAELPPVDKSGD